MAIAITYTLTEEQYEALKMAAACFVVLAEKMPGMPEHAKERADAAHAVRVKPVVHWMQDAA